MIVLKENISSSEISLKRFSFAVKFEND